MSDIKLDWGTQHILSQLANLYGELPSIESAIAWHDDNPNWKIIDMVDMINGSCRIAGTYDVLYDLLSKDNMWIPPSPELKKKLWDNARKHFNATNQIRIKTLNVIYENELKKAVESNKMTRDEIVLAAKQRADKVLKDDLNKVFKSFMVRSFVADKYYNGHEIVMKDEDNNIINRLKWKQEQ